jgi:hypothetical protein
MFEKKVPGGKKSLQALASGIQRLRICHIPSPQSAHILEQNVTLALFRRENTLITS